MMNIDSELLEINKELIGLPVLVTTWYAYGIIHEVKDANTFLVMNKWREIKEVDKFHIRTLNSLQKNLQKQVFDMPVIEEIEYSKI